MLSNGPLFTAISNPDQLQEIDENALKPFQLCSFWKNKQGQYLGCNNTMARLLGFEKGTDLIGATDFDLCWSKYANSFIDNDKKVISTEAAQIAIEKGQLISGKEIPAFSYKFPLRLTSQKIDGIICIAIPFVTCENLEVEAIPQLPPQGRLSTFEDSVKKYALTQRQTACLYYVTRGMSIKEISKQLRLSPRTVEHYLEAIKIKLNCHSRSQLIAKVFPE